MKSRTLFTIFFIAAFFIIIALPNSSQAITFPIEYRGELHVKQTFGSGPSCEAIVPIYIQLRPEGTIYGILPFDFKNTTKSNDLNSCEIVQTDTYEPEYLGKHDKNGTFEIPIKILGNYLMFSITGSFDDLQITGVGSGSSYNGHMNMNITLKAPAVGVNQPPQITLEPATYPEFQINVLEGKGFTVTIRKEDGVMDSQGNWKLDFSTFVIETDGVNNSMHFIETAINKNIISWAADDKEVQFIIMPDPKKFMLEQNVFNIMLNGEHKIGLKICDTDGRCGKSEYTLYFGPFVFVGSVTDLRCAKGTEHLDLKNLVLGNLGHASPLTGLYMALINIDPPNEIWYFADIGGYGYIGVENRVTPLFDGLSYSEADIIKADHFLLDLHYSFRFGAFFPYPFPAGNFAFAALILDDYSGAYKLYMNKDVKTCSLP